jgi:hypothetical protein
MNAQLIAHMKTSEEMRAEFMRRFYTLSHEELVEGWQRIMEFDRLYNKPLLFRSEPTENSEK